MTRFKIATIGVGNIGGVVAALAAERELADVVLIDSVERADFARGKALDVSQFCAVAGSDAQVMGSGQMEDVEGAHVCIVSAGMPRTPGMSREDLLEVNVTVIRAIAQVIRERAPSSFIVVITNPLDVLTYEMRRMTGFPPNKVVGMAGMLDSARLRYFIAEAVGCSIKEVNALVLGGHGDAMVPVLSYCSVNGIPVRHLLDNQKLDSIVERTRYGGSEVVKLMGTSGYFAAAACAVDMAESYLKDHKRLLSCSGFLQGQYGLSGMYMGVPVIISANGVERVVEIPLTEDEQAALQKSALLVREQIDMLEDIGRGVQ